MSMILATLTAVALVIGMGPGHAGTSRQGPQEPPLVKKIKKVEWSTQDRLPPNLVVDVVGEVPTGGYTNVKLIRVKHTTPPKDGIQEYRLVATPPDGPATQVITELKARDVWKAYTQEAPWLKGVRVLGVGEGVVVKKVDE
jgi:hypothetical protein